MAIQARSEQTTTTSPIYPGLINPFVNQIPNLQINPSHPALASDTGVHRTEKPSKENLFKDLNKAKKSQIPKGSEILTFDLDETLVSCNKLTKKMKKQGQELGFQLSTSKEGREFFIRPGAIELLKHLKEEGFKIVVSSRNLHHYEDDIVYSSPLGKYVDYTTGVEDLVVNGNFDRSKYPNHPINKIGFFVRSGRFIKTMLKGFFVDILYRSFRHYILRDKNIKPYFPQARWKLDKYPPQLSGSRVLFDNLYKENFRNCKASQDWVAVDPGEFYGNEEEPKNEQGEYQWVANIKKAAHVLKTQGWQELYKRELGEDPIDAPVEVAQPARENASLKEVLI